MRLLPIPPSNHKVYWKTLLKQLPLVKQVSVKTTIEQSSLPENTVNKAPKVVSQMANKAEVLRLN